MSPAASAAPRAAALEMWMSRATKALERPPRRQRGGGGLHHRRQAAREQRDDEDRERELPLRTHADAKTSRHLKVVRSPRPAPDTIP